MGGQTYAVTLFSQRMAEGQEGLYITTATDYLDDNVEADGEGIGL